MIGNSFYDYGKHQISLKNDQKVLFYLLKENLPQVNTKISIDSIENIPDPSLIDCSYDEMDSRLFTLEQLRYIDICRVDFGGKSIVKSDKTGYAVLNETKLIRGPAGLYSVSFKNIDDFNDFMNNDKLDIGYYDDSNTDSRRILQSGVNETVNLPLDFNLIKLKNNIYDSKIIASSSDLFFAKTDVFNIEFLNQNEFKGHIEIGVPISPAPKIRITDILGNPLIGKTIIVYSYITYSHGAPLKYNIKANKFALLKNNISPPTDSRGETLIPDFTIMGANFKSIYLIFSCDGVTSSMHTNINKNYLSLSNHYIPPTSLLTSVKNLTVKVTQKDIFEGEFFKNPPLIRVLDINNNPISGKVVFAEIVKIGSKKSKYGLFLKNKFSSTKKLKFSLNGDYYLNTHDFYPDSKTFKNPVLTNTNGEVLFKNLLFDYDGNVDGLTNNYTITLNFICDGVISENVDFIVKTKVTYAWVYFLTKRIIVKENEAHFINVMFGATDQYDNYIYTKYPQKYYLKDKNNTVMSATVVPFYSSSIQVNPEYGTVDLFISNIGNLTMEESYNICITIDNVEACNSEDIVIGFDNEINNNLCSFINIKVFTKSGLNKLNLFESFNLTGKITNLKNIGIYSSNL